jgi:hypothetical protein
MCVRGRGWRANRSSPGLSTSNAVHFRQRDVIHSHGQGGEGTVQAQGTLYQGGCHVGEVPITLCFPCVGCEGG